MLVEYLCQGQDNRRIKKTKLQSDCSADFHYVSLNYLVGICMVIGNFNVSSVRERVTILAFPF